ncbi:MAG: prolipoprotein diacylglyceryl transferase [Planctomycetaceae bacterium]|jgi:phosphatidylglycerol:prolipoprotein diacylglycerol transferase|nr:prolipoprotein diacylglyceryl transferase [Planctomycetaceae bacterium]
MRQTLFYIPEEFFGISLVGNGILFWGIILGAIFWTIQAVYRAKFDSDTIGFLGILAVAAFLVRFFLPRILEENGFPIRGYGVMLLLAITTSFALLSRRAKKKWNIPTDILLSMVLWCVIFGLIGARLFHVVEYWPQYIRETWNESVIAMLMYSEGGLVVYGAIFGGLAGALIFFTRNKLPVLATFDLLAPVLFLGLAFGRIGCFLNGCCFGGVCDPGYGVVFPPGSPASDYQVMNGLVPLGGLKFQNLTAQEIHLPSKQTFGCLCCNSIPKKAESDRNENTSPAVIETVQPGSSAEQAGIRPGMTVLRVVDVAPNGERREYYGKNGHITQKQFLEEWLFPMSLYHPDHSLTLLVREPDSPVEKTVTFVPGKLEVLPVLPTQLYSSALALGLCLLFLGLDRFCKRDGTMTFLFFLFYPCVRFVIEMLRVDESSFMRTGLSISQNISILALIGAVCLGFYIFSRPPQHAYQNMFPKDSE